MQVLRRMALLPEAAGLVLIRQPELLLQEDQEDQEAHQALVVAAGEAEEILVESR